ncbi:MAG TPA: hypothetical protein PLU30_13830 [Verrucomicrobiae bacterium]|nr:hypothetical protein [Verrucomicrobiae bacterium]
MRIGWRKGHLLAALAITVLQGPTEHCLAESGEATAPRAPRWFGYRTSYYQFDAETLRRFGEAGVHVVNFHPFNVISALGVPYSPYPPVWMGPGKYDFDSLDRHFNDILAANPHAKFVCKIDLNTPAWWPRWLGQSKVRDDSFTKLGKVAGSEEWRRETREYLQAFLRYTEAKYRDKIVGYMLACGNTNEWQDMSMGEESASRRQAWRKWMIGKGFPDPIDIPPASVREHVSNGIFRDPVDDAMAINYWRFHHWLIGDAILWFASSAQEILQHRVPLGTYSGYVLEHATGRLLYEGHLDFDRVFSSPLLDFIETPGSYHDRQLGGASGFMVCLDSLNLHGKRLIHQFDHRTHTARSVTLLGLPIPGHKDGFPDEKATIAGMRRDFAMALVRGTSLWWFNMFGHWFDGKPVMDSIAQMRDIWERCADDSAKSVAQVAVLVDAESMFYVDGNARILDGLLSRQRFGLGRMGAPYEIYSFADLPRLDLSRFKLILLPNLFVVDDAKRRWLRSKVCAGGKTVVWVHAPGIIADGRYDPANVKDLTGIPLEAQALTTQPMDGWRSVLSPEPNLSAETLRHLASEAGVHIYCDAGEPLYANGRFVALHSLSGGRRTIKLPERCGQVRELFSGRIVGENTDTIEDDLLAPDTVLYELRN